MDKPLRIIIFVVLGLVVFHLVFDLFNTRSNIKTVIKNLEKSREKVDSALNEIKFSQDKLKTMQNDLDTFAVYVRDIQGRVEFNDNEKRKTEARSIKERDSLKARIKNWEEQLRLNDTVPRITVKWQ